MSSERPTAPNVNITGLKKKKTRRAVVQEE